MRHRALARSVIGEGVRAGAADVVLVLGNVGQVREIAERPNDADRLVGRLAAERAAELPPRGCVRVALAAQAGLPQPFDQGENLVALLNAHRVAQDASEQSNVVAKRNVLVWVYAAIRGVHRAQSARLS